MPTPAMPTPARTRQTELIARALCDPPAVVLLAGGAGLGKSWLVREVLRHPLLHGKPVRVLDDADAPIPDDTELAGSGSTLLTYRPEEADLAQLAEQISALRAPVSVLEVAIEPLSLVEVAELAETRSGVPVPAEIARLLLDYTGGVPRTLEELLHQLNGLRLEQLSVQALEECPVPAVTRHIALARLARLTPDARIVVAVASAASSAGMPVVGDALLGAVASLDDDRLCTALSSAVQRAALAEQDGGYRLPHRLAARAGYESLPGPQRRRLHLKLAEQLSDDPAAAAGHYRCAGRIDDWVRHAEAGVELAIAAGDVPVAVRLLREVLAGPGLSRSELTRIGLKFGVATEHAAEYDKFVAVLRELVDDISLPRPTLGELRLNLGLLLGNQAGDAEAGERELMRAIPDLAHQPNLQARAMSALSVPGTNLRSAADNLDWLRRTEQIAEQITDPGIQAAIDVNAATTLMAIGEPAAFRRARVLFQPPSSMEVSLQLRRGCLNAADAATWLGHYRRARAFIRRGCELTADADHSTYAGIGLESIGLLVDWFTGAWTGLRERAEPLAHNKDVPRLAAEATFVAASLDLVQGAGIAAVRRLEEIASYTVYEVSPPVQALTAADLVRWWRAKGDIDAAMTHAERALEATRAKQIWPWASDLIPAYAGLLVTDDRARAEALVAEFAAGVQGRDAPVAWAALAHCAAVLSGEPEAWLRAGRMYQLLPRPYQALLMREAAGTVTVQRTGDPGLLLGALAEYETMSAGFDVSRCRNMLRRNGVEPPRRTRRRGYGLKLSPRESEVVSLAADGSTNAEIAAALYLSPRTVEQHVARALRKLGLRSRRELIANQQFGNGAAQGAADHIKVG